jgi:uncharacterized membrane protein YsdA (DUF1294 family)
MSTVRRKPGSIGMISIVMLIALLLLPGYALFRSSLPFDWRFLSGVVLAVSVLTYALYGSDKRRAQASEWRIAESMLHFCELMGGWPGAFLAQRRFRHKISKASYQCMFWLIVLLHQLVALDSLRGWAISKELLRMAQSRDT